MTKRLTKGERDRLRHRCAAVADEDHAGADWAEVALRALDECDALEADFAFAQRERLRIDALRATLVAERDEARQEAAGLRSMAVQDERERRELERELSDARRIHAWIVADEALAGRAADAELDRVCEERDAALARAERAERERDILAEALTAVGIPDDYDTVLERAQRLVEEYGTGEPCLLELNEEGDDE